VALFHVIEKEMEWRKQKGLPVGFEAMQASKPIIAVGPEHPLEDEILMADYFREQLLHDIDTLRLTRLDGVDGLAGVHTSVCTSRCLEDASWTNSFSTLITLLQRPGRLFSKPVKQLTRLKLLILQHSSVLPRLQLILRFFDCSRRMNQTRL